MTGQKITDWDDAYANGAHINGAETYPPRWAEEAKSFRNSWMKKDLDVVYGDSARQRLDVFHPEGKSKGLVIFVHGGYWMKFDKSYWSHLAQGALAKGWAVCLPSYDLAPNVQIFEITKQVSQAVIKAAQRVEGPIRLTGHSAGGHLVTRMVCKDTSLPADVLDRIEKVVSISGLHDMRPLRKTEMNDTFGLSEDDAVAESTALMDPVREIPVTAWVGGDERPEFIRQSRLLADAWSNVNFHEEADKHHFDVVEALTEPGSPLTSELLGN
ncbi:MAG: alpha/beta hydrolase [Roseibium sp.]